MLLSLSAAKSEYALGRVRLERFYCSHIMIKKYRDVNNLSE